MPRSEEILREVHLQRVGPSADGAHLETIAIEFIAAPTHKRRNQIVRIVGAAEGKF